MKYKTIQVCVGEESACRVGDVVSRYCDVYSLLHTLLYKAMGTGGVGDGRCVLRCGEVK